MRRLWRQFQLDWEEGLRRLPFFTQGTTSTTSTTTPDPTLLPPISPTLPLP